MTISAIGQLMGAGGLVPVDAAKKPAKAEGDFGNIVTTALQGLQNTQDKADGLAVKAATGDMSDVHDFTIASTEAALTTEFTVAVRNRAVEAFNEIMRMQI